ncbi:hypothetical protein [Streptomyces sp. NPDC048639]|uniref:hypothetical protein n=1 Tax=Streptomyces sp. NPDC048639 TaxID=3365581 RepID=UPI003720734B
MERTLTDSRQGSLFRAVIAAAGDDTRTAGALHRFYEVRIAEWAPCVRQATEADAFRHRCPRSAPSPRPPPPSARQWRPPRRGGGRPRRRGRGGGRPAPGVYRAKGADQV